MILQHTSQKNVLTVTNVIHTYSLWLENFTKFSATTKKKRRKVTIKTIVYVSNLSFVSCMVKERNLSK